ncbi:MAG: cysteine desulfurase [Planctomycetes bacterium]|nr:cysteine desulfurase [Planctomycetota bacterium]
MRPIYLDYNATTPVHPQVAAFMNRVLFTLFGNPSSAHAEGREAHDLIEEARAEAARALGARPREIIFTSGGSEANNLAIKGVAWNRGRGHIISQKTEHPSVLEPLRFLEKHGFRVTLLPVDPAGRVDPAAVEKAITADTILITIQHANNETGTLQPIEEIGAVARQRGIPVHADAAQSVGKVPVEVGRLGADLLTAAGHKLYAPKGAGLLYARDGVALEPLIHGAGHERGRRAGTEATHQIAGLALALRLVTEDLETAAERLQAGRDRLHRRLEAEIPGLVLHGYAARRLPNTLNLGFPEVTGAELLEATPEVAASTGSACHSGEVRLSPVLEAMGVAPESGRGAVRLSVGRPSSMEEVDRAADLLIASWKRLRGLL